MTAGDLRFFSGVDIRCRRRRSGRKETGYGGLDVWGVSGDEGTSRKFTDKTEDVLRMMRLVSSSEDALRTTTRSSRVPVSCSSCSFKYKNHRRRYRSRVHREISMNTVIFFVLSAATESFGYPVALINRANRIRSCDRSTFITRNSEGCDYCSGDDNDDDVVAELPSHSIIRQRGRRPNDIVDKNVEELLVLPNPSIRYISRRKLIHFASTVVGISSIATAPAYEANGAETNENANSAVALSNTNFIPIGDPIPPFSTTRTYRNIVLSNGLKVVLVKDSLVQRSSVALSIGGAGMFSEPADIPGLAHLMEHIVLSSTRFSSKNILDRKARRIWNTRGDQSKIPRDTSGEQAFSDWLSENDGDANAFTAPGFVCFHLSSPHEILPEALERFSRLFSLDEIENTIAKGVIPREVGRVADELDRSSDFSRSLYYLKSNMNPEHPFARFSAGSKATLQTIPLEKGIDVAAELIHFFRDHYLASKATLVVIGRDDLSALDRWISPFSNAMSQKGSGQTFYPPFPDPMIKRDIANGITQAIILRSKDDVQMDEDCQTLCMEWPLALVYDKDVEIQQPLHQKKTIITAHAVGFVLTQIISRRGPGSLRFFLEKFGWSPKIGSKALPKISIPVDTNGFQILRMEIGLTLDGFSNRSAVVSAVFESIRKILEKPLQFDLMKQYLATGLIHGYLFSGRPPEAVALSVDSLRFGVGGPRGIASNDFNWYLMPSPNDEESVRRITQVVTDTLIIMSDDSGPLVSFRASPKAVFAFGSGIIDQAISIPPVFSPWQKEPITGARYLVEHRANGALSYFKSLSWFAATFDGEELLGPYLNPLLPTNIRAPRPFTERQTNVPLEGGSRWKLWQISPSTKDLIGLPLPVRPPEPSSESAFVVQLLSSIPATFTSHQLLLADLWLLSFDDEVLNLAELGAIAGIAYETSMNKSGLRLCFRGLSQTLPSYVRRFCRKLVQHHTKLLDGSIQLTESVYERAIADAKRSPEINQQQKQDVIDTVKQVTEKEVGEHGLFFLKCTTGGILISQGDVLPNESMKLVAEIQDLFSGFGEADGFAVQPDLRDLLYKPVWKPRDASLLCLLPGITLISDGCGRIPRGG